MAKFGYAWVSVDHCINIWSTKDETSIVAIHVDNILGCTSSKQEMKWLKKDLEGVFKIKDMGKAHWLLRVSISCDGDSRTMSLSQTAYVDAMVKHYKMQDTYPVHTHQDTHV